MTNSQATIADIEELFSDTMEKVGVINEQVLDIQDTIKVLPEMNSMMKAMINTQASMANAQNVMAEAAKSMAATFDRAEIRQAQLEISNTKLYEHKGVSNTVFAMVVGTLLLVIVALVIWGTGLNLKGSFTNLEISQQRHTRDLKEHLANTTGQVIEEVNENYEKIDELEKKGEKK